MISITLTPEQQAALKAGRVTREDALSIRGAINSALRETRSGGRTPTCECGECRNCKRREDMRKQRAGGNTPAHYSSVPKKLSMEAIKFFQEAGRKGGQIGGASGGQKAAATMTPEKRVERARKAAAQSAAVRKKRAGEKKSQA